MAVRGTRKAKAAPSPGRGLDKDLAFWGAYVRLFAVAPPAIPSSCREMAACRFYSWRPAKEATHKKRPSRRAEGHALEVENVAYKFRGYPDGTQQHELSQNIGGCRWMWNRLKHDRDAVYRELGADIHNTPAEYKDMEGLEWLGTLDSYALCNVQLDHERAYREWLSGEKGAPRYKKKHRAKASYTTTKDKRCGNICIRNGCLVLPKISGPIRLKMHRPLPGCCTVKAVTVCHEPDGKWTFSILCEKPAKEVRLPEGIEAFMEDGDAASISHVGLDMSLPYLFVDSDGCLPSYMNDGVLVEFRKAYKALEEKIAREQRRLSKMEKGSNNYRRQCRKVAKLHAKAKQQRDDFLHQVAVRLARGNDIISIEDLDMAAMKQALCFGKSVSDNGWGRFTGILEQKCREYGCVLVRVGKWFPSSKTCCHCGYVHKELKLTDRAYVCPRCGHAMGRDHQAAINIDIEGLRIVLSWREEPKEAIKPAGIRIRVA